MTVATKNKRTRVNNPARIDPMDSPDMLEKMYVANVSLDEIARYFGYSSHNKIREARRLLGIKDRPGVNKCLTVSEFFERRTAKDPAEIAAEDAACRALLGSASENSFKGPNKKKICLGKYSVGYCR